MLDLMIMITQQCRCTIIKCNLVNKFNFLLFINFKIVRIMFINLVFNSSSIVLRAIIKIKTSIKNQFFKVAIRHSKINNIVSNCRSISLINQINKISNETRSIFNHCNRITIFLLSTLIIVFISLNINQS